MQGVIGAAAVSKAHFYRAFQGLPDCILATYAMAAGAALEVVDEACGSSAEASLRVSEAVVALFEFLGEEPELANVLTDPALLDVPGFVDVRDSFTVALAQGLSSARRPTTWSGAFHEQIDLHLVRAARAWTLKRLESRAGRPLAGSAGELVTLVSLAAPSD